MRTRELLIAGGLAFPPAPCDRPGGTRLRGGGGSWGVVGLRMADAHPPDLILLDLEGPNMDRYEVCRALHKGWRTKQIPIVMLVRHFGHRHAERRPQHPGGDASLREHLGRLRRPERSTSSFAPMNPAQRSTRPGTLR